MASRALGGLTASFGQHVAAIEPQSPFDPRSRAVYLIAGFMFVAEAIAIAATDFTFSPGAFLPIFGLSLWLTFSGLLARRYGHNTIAIALECMGLPALIGGLAGAGTSMMAAISVPFVDHSLDMADRALGLDWMALFRLYQRNDWLTDASRYCYTSLYMQIILLPIVLLVRRQHAMIWTFITAWTVTGVITLCLFPLFPAEGPYIHYGIVPSDLPRLFRVFPWEFSPSITGLRIGTIRDLSHGVGGLVSMPSFHAAAAVILGCVWAKQRWYFAPLILLNVAMFLASMVSGAHYLVDLLAGGVVGAIGLWIAGRLVTQDSTRV